jgi:hypothetical protein
MPTFTASRLSEGNRIFPDQIIIDEDSVTIKSPKLFGGNATSFPLGQITMSIDSPFLGFCDIKFSSQGTNICVHGFTDNDSKRIKRLINERNTGNTSKKSYSSSNKDTKRYRPDEDINFNKQMSEASALADENINKYSLILTKAMVDIAFIDEKSKDEIDDIEFKATKARSYLEGLLRKWYSNDRYKFDQVVKECADEADKQIAKINLERKGAKRISRDRESEYFGDSDEYSYLKTHFSKIMGVIFTYDEQLDINLLENNEKCNEHKRLIKRYSKHILSIEGLQDFKSSLEDVYDKDEYTEQLKILLKIIEDCYFITNHLTHSEKKQFGFGLQLQSVHEFILDSDTSSNEKISKIIDCVDNLVNRYSTYIDSAFK